MRAVLALGGGVNNGSGSRDPSSSPRAAECRRPFRRPGTPSSPSRPGSRAPRTPRETSVARFTSIERPSSWSAYGCSAAGNWLTSAVIRWLGTMIAQQVEPEQRNLREDLALAGNARAQHVIEGRDAVGGHQQQRVHRPHRDRAPCRGQAAAWRPDSWSGELSLESLTSEGTESPIFRRAARLCQSRGSGSGAIEQRGGALSGTILSRLRALSE